MGLFKRGAKAAAKPGSRKSEPLPNTPPVVDNAGVRLFAELFGDPQANGARWFVFAMLEGVVIACMALTIKALLPLKQIVPYQVDVTDAGVIARVVEASQYRPTPAMIRSELSRWTEHMMVLDPHLTRDNLKRAVTLLRGKAVSEHADFMREQRPFERLLENPTLVRTVQIKSVDASQDGVAFVFLTTTERINGEPTIKTWRFTVQYTIITPQDEKELLANPAGLVITHFEHKADLT